MPYDIENIFTYHAPINDQLQRYDRIRKKAREIAQLILKLTPQSREQEIALVNLEQSIFWANAAIARNEQLKSD